VLGTIRRRRDGEIGGAGLRPSDVGLTLPVFIKHQEFLDGP